MSIFSFLVTVVRNVFFSFTVLCTTAGCLAWHDVSSN